MNSYRAEYDYFCCGFCCLNCDGICMDRSRRYMYVLENGYEQSNPTGCPNNCLCPGDDSVQKFYFDRGVYNQQSLKLCRSLHCIQGAPSIIANNVKYTCCCRECNSTVNACCDQCYFPSLCGDRVRVLPCESFCYCCPARACFLHNCCGLCGPKDGEPLPLLMTTLEAGLKLRTGYELVTALEGARGRWQTRTGGE
ncbi:hypothetical protein EON64_05875 [archaeon]|nr:MAG: hypothetical protein EON64_05875 [archaeon]